VLVVREHIVDGDLEGIVGKVSPTMIPATPRRKDPRATNVTIGNE